MHDSTREDAPSRDGGGTEFPAPSALGLGPVLHQPPAAATPAYRQLVRSDFERPRRRRVLLPVVLFLATCASTYIAGALSWDPTAAFGPDAARLLAQNWRQGLIYM